MTKEGSNRLSALVMIHNSVFSGLMSSSFLQASMGTRGVYSNPTGQSTLSDVTKTQALESSFSPSSKAFTPCSGKSTLFGRLGLKTTFAEPLTCSLEHRHSKQVITVLALCSSGASSKLMFYCLRIYAAFLTVSWGSWPAPLVLQRQFHALTAAARVYHCSSEVLARACHLLWSIALLCWSSSLVSYILAGIYRSQLGASGCFAEDSLGIRLANPLPLNICEKSVMSSSSS